MSIKKGLLCLLMLCVLCIIFLQFDNNLSPQAQKLAKNYQQQYQKPSPAFNYLVGLSAPVKADAMANGKNRVTDRLAGKAEAIDTIALPTHAALCSMMVNTTACVQDMFKHKNQWQTLTKTHSTLTWRYRTFLKFNEYTTKYPASTDMLFPDFQYLVMGQKLSMLEAFQLAEKGKTDAAIHDLITELTLIRKHLSMADTLINKMIYVAMVRQQLQAIAILKTKYNATYQQAIPLLTQAEMDMSKPMNYEYVFMEAAVGNITNKSSKTLPNIKNIPSFMLKTVFKKNMSLNQRAENLNTVVSYAKLPMHKLATQLAQPKKTTWQVLKLRNLLGSYLNSLSDQTTYDRYVARSSDLNIYIASVNYLLSNKKKKPVNPYSPSLTQIAINKQMICMQGLQVSQNGSQQQCIIILE